VGFCPEHDQALFRDASKARPCKKNLGTFPHRDQGREERAHDLTASTKELLCTSSEQNEIREIRQHNEFPNTHAVDVVTIPILINPQSLQGDIPVVKPASEDLCIGASGYGRVACEDDSGDEQGWRHCSTDSSKVDDESLGNTQQVRIRVISLAVFDHELSVH
jgi:hypothetical protein